MRLSVRQLRRVIRESILKEYSILDGPYAPHVNQKKHQQAMDRLRIDAMDFANTAGPASILQRMEYSYPDFVSMCSQQLESPNIGALDEEEIFAECCLEYCHDMSEKQINRFVASMHSPG